MPHWCDNRLTVYGVSAATIVQEYGSSEHLLDFNKILPVVQPDLDIQIKQWGTKWQALDMLRCGNTFIFDTAWSPPFGLVTELSRLYPSAQFVLHYSEPGEGFDGCAAFVAGTKIIDARGGYDADCMRSGLVMVGYPLDAANDFVADDFGLDEDAAIQPGGETDGGTTQSSIPPNGA